MKSSLVRSAVLCVILILGILSAYADDCPYSLVKTSRVTNSQGKSRTARNNARCICHDATGTVHMVWEDTRNGNLEVYYATATSDTLSTEVRVTSSRGESSYPCVACDSQDVYILWQEHTGKVFDVFYVHLSDGEEVARKPVTQTYLDSSCPVAAVGPDGALHIAWHEGPYKQTAIYYGKIVGDTMVVREPICTVHPEAFRPDIACDDTGRMLIAWFEGLEVKSKYWNGTSWGEEQLVATNGSRPWRLSVAAFGEDKWALAWFDNTAEGSDVLVKFFDGDSWYGQSAVDEAKIAYYPSIRALGNDEIGVVWEEKDPEANRYRLILRCWDGKEWSEHLQLYLESMAGRYPSMTCFNNELHAVWFSAKAGNDEIYHGFLRRK